MPRVTGDAKAAKKAPAARNGEGQPAADAGAAPAADLRRTNWTVMT
jgi:hypothetical protein